jgi:hypothetical protein
LAECLHPFWFLAGQTNRDQVCRFQPAMQDIPPVGQMLESEKSSALLGVVHFFTAFSAGCLIQGLSIYFLAN